MRIPSGVTDQYIYFVAVDSTDLATRETGLSSFTVYRSRNGGAAAAFTTPTINETDSTNMPGVYELLLDEDMTIDSGDDSQEMVFHITHAGMAPVTRTIELYRPKITAGYTLGVESDGDLTKVNTLDGHTAQTGDSYARIGAPVGASISADLQTIEGQTDDIGAAGAGLNAIPWNSAWDSEVQSEVDDALTAYGLQYILATALPTSWSANVTANSALDYLADDGTATFDRTTDSLQAIKDAGVSIDLATMFTTDTGETYGTSVAGSVVKEIADNAGGSSLTVADIADGVWDEAQSGHVGAGTFGEIATEIASILVDTGTTLDGKIDTLDTVADGIKAVTDNLPDSGALSSLATAAALATVDTNVDAILVDTGTTLDGKIDTIDGIVDAILLDTAEIGAAGAGLTEAGGTGDQLTALATAASIAALNDISAAEVNAEVVDALQTDTPVDGYSITDALQFVAAVCAGRISGAGTGTETFLGLDEATTRVVVTVDASGNRSDIVYST